MKCSCGRTADKTNLDQEEFFWCPVEACKKLYAYCECAPMQDQSGFSPAIVSQAQSILNQESDAQADAIAHPYAITHENIEAITLRILRRGE